MDDGCSIALVKEWRGRGIELPGKDENKLINLFNKFFLVMQFSIDLCVSSL